jgi:xylulokinase
MMADAFGMNISVSNSKQGGALGVAILAGVGAGIYGSVPSACAALIGTKETTVCNAGNTEIYNKYYKLYGELYERLRPCFKEL